MMDQSKIQQYFLNNTKPFSRKKRNMINPNYKSSKSPVHSSIILQDYVEAVCFSPDANAF